MWKKKFGAFKNLALLAVLGPAYQVMAQDATTPYPHMAPIDEYLMTDQGEEIALARSAAPKSISRDAEVLVLKSNGYERGAKGKNVPGPPQPIPKFGIRKSARRSAITQRRRVPTCRATSREPTWS
jgi:hypothetical protein